MMHHVQGLGTGLYSGKVPLETTADADSFLLMDETRGGGIFTYNYSNNSSPSPICTSTSNSAWTGVQVDVRLGFGQDLRLLEDPA